MATVRLFGEVNEEMLEKFSEALSEADDSLTVELCSSGGDANVALAMYGLMRTAGVQVRVVAMGEISSAAILVLAGGHTRAALSETWFMVHEEQIETSGSVTQIERETEAFRRAERFWGDLLAAKTNASSEYWQSIHTETTYLDAAEALELGLIQEIL